MSQATTPLLSVHQAAARSNTYRLLARFWQTEVNADLLQVLRTPPLSEAFVAAGGVLPNDDPATVEQLAIDFCQLFVGPKNHLPPFQSVWVHGQLDAEPTVSMQRYCEIVGYDVSELPSGMLLDHLGAQLEVMAHVLQIVSETERDQLEPVRELGRRYFLEHLMWAADLLAATEAQATTEFYVSLAMMTRQFLDSENAG